MTLAATVAVLPLVGDNPVATVHGAGEAAEKVGVIVVALLAAIVVLGRPPRISERSRAVAMLAALVLTPVLLLIDIWHVPQLEHLRRHSALAVAAVAIALGVVLGLALLFRRCPQALALAAVFTLPFRLPISTDGSSSNLLIPLYLVVAAGALAYLLARLPGANGRAAVSAGGGPPDRAGPPGRAGSPDRAAPGAVDAAGWLSKPRRPTRAQLPRLVTWLLMGTIVLYGVQSTYSPDFTKALENMVFFYVPFALLFRLLADVQWTPRLLLWCLGVAVGLALALSGVGFVEYARKQLFLNPSVVAANEFSGYFRVNSLFFDPNIYGRFLALVMIGVTVVVLAPGGAGARRTQVVLAGGVVLVWLWCGLVTSFSQSSIAALLLGLAILAGWRWDTRSTVYVSVSLAVIAGVVWFAAPSSLHFGLNGAKGSANNATNGRTNLITGGLSLFEDRPLQGFGSGSFSTEYLAHHEEASVVSTTDSHTIPVTVAAEQGIIGLVLYVALLVTAFGMLFADVGRSPPGILIAACFAALVLHTWTYADFLEDPITWVLLGIGVALAAGRGGRSVPARDPAARPVRHDLAELAPGGAPE